MYRWKKKLQQLSEYCMQCLNNKNFTGPKFSRGKLLFISHPHKAVFVKHKKIVRIYDE